MTNPYAPPLAPVADIVQPTPFDIEAPFFPVSLTKLLVMSVCTLSLYEVYWFYQNWKRIGRREPGRVLPAARAIFAVFFCYQCFGKIRDYDSRVAGKLAAGPLAAGWILSTITWKLPDPYWWIAMIAVIFMLPVQACVNNINSAIAPTHHRNGRFTVWNWLAIVPGGLLVLLAIFGTIFPDG